VDAAGSVATVELGKFWECRPILIALEKTAFHECCEILLHDLWNLASRGSSEFEVEYATHNAIRSLEAMFFKTRKHEFAHVVED